MEASIQEVYNRLQLHFLQACHHQQNYFFFVRAMPSRLRDKQCSRRKVKRSLLHYRHHYYPLISKDLLHGEHGFGLHERYTVLPQPWSQIHLVDLEIDMKHIIKILQRLGDQKVFQPSRFSKNQFSPSTVLSSAKLSREFPFSWREKHVRWQVSSLSIRSWWISWTNSIDET